MNRLSTIRPFYILCLLMLSIGLVATANAEATDNLFSNGDFAQVKDNGEPAAWSRKAGDGTLSIVEEKDITFARLDVGPTEKGHDNFIQQIPKLPERANKLYIEVTYRWEGIEPGPKKYMRGKVQARFTDRGKDFGDWYDLGNLSGSSDDWVTKKQELDVPERADGLMLRVGFYGTKAGRLDIAHARLKAITPQDLAAERAKYRPAAPYGEPVSDERFARITNGVNINGWFCQPWNQKVNGKKGGFNAEHFRAYITEEDIAVIKSMGFDHVRLAMDPIFLIDVQQGGTLKAELLGELDRAIQMMRDHGLAVIVDAHPKNQTFKKMADKPDVREAFVAWWGQFAKHLSDTTDPDWVFLELLNEPGGQGYWANDEWEAYQDRLITAVRAGAPEHTIIANGGSYMLVDDLDKVTPHPDRNIIWAIHYYEPSPFTHQGADWMKDWYGALRDVPWPVTQENLDETVASLKNRNTAKKAGIVLRDLVRKNDMSREHLEQEIARIAEWSKANNIRVHVGEYGVIDLAPRDSRLSYLKAITEAFEKHGIGRAVWNYSGSNYTMVLGPDEPGQRKPDPELAEALGLMTGSTE